jgi:hypothetical protein
MTVGWYILAHRLRRQNIRLLQDWPHGGIQRIGWLISYKMTKERLFTPFGLNKKWTLEQECYKKQNLASKSFLINKETLVEIFFESVFKKLKCDCRCLHFWHNCCFLQSSVSLILITMSLPEEQPSYKEPSSPVGQMQSGLAALFVTPSQKKKWWKWLQKFSVLEHLLKLKKHAECFFKQNLKTNSAAVKQYWDSLSPNEKAQILVQHAAQQQKYWQSLSPENKA